MGKRKNPTKAKDSEEKEADQKESFENLLSNAVAGEKPFDLGSQIESGMETFPSSNLGVSQQLAGFDVAELDFAREYSQSLSPQRQKMARLPAPSQEDKYENTFIQKELANLGECLDEIEEFEERAENSKRKRCIWSIKFVATWYLNSVCYPHDPTWATFPSVDDLTTSIQNSIYVPRMKAYDDVFNLLQSSVDTGHSLVLPETLSTKKEYQRILREFNNPEPRVRQQILKRRYSENCMIRASQRYGVKTARGLANYIRFLFECVKTSPLFQRQLVILTEDSITSLYEYCLKKYSDEVFKMSNYASVPTIKDMIKRLKLLDDPLARAGNEVAKLSQTASVDKANNDSDDEAADNGDDNEDVGVDDDGDSRSGDMDFELVEYDENYTHFLVNKVIRYVLDVQDAARISYVLPKTFGPFVFTTIEPLLATAVTYPSEAVKCHTKLEVILASENSARFYLEPSAASLEWIFDNYDQVNACGACSLRAAYMALNSSEKAKVSDPDLNEPTQKANFIKFFQNLCDSVPLSENKKQFECLLDAIDARKSQGTMIPQELWGSIDMISELFSVAKRRLIVITPAIDSKSWCTMMFHPKWDKNDPEPISSKQRKKGRRFLGNNFSYQRVLEIFQFLYEDGPVICFRSGHFTYVPGKIVMEKMFPNPGAYFPYFVQKIIQYDEFEENFETWEKEASPISLDSFPEPPLKVSGESDSEDPFYAFNRSVFTFVRKVNLAVTNKLLIGIGDVGCDGEPTCSPFNSFVQYIFQKTLAKDRTNQICVDFGSGIGSTVMSHFGYCLGYNVLGFEINLDRLRYSWKLQKCLMEHEWDISSDVESCIPFLPMNSNGASYSSWKEYAVSQTQRFRFNPVENSAVDILSYFQSNQVHASKVTVFYMFCKGWSPVDIVTVFDQILPLFTSLRFFLTNFSPSDVSNPYFKFDRVLSRQVPLKESGGQKLTLNLYEVFNFQTLHSAPFTIATPPTTLTSLITRMEHEVLKKRPVVPSTETMNFMDLQASQWAPKSKSSRTTNQNLKRIKKVSTALHSDKTLQGAIEKVLAPIIKHVKKNEPDTKAREIQNALNAYLSEIIPSLLSKSK